MAIKTLDSATESTPPKLTFEAGSETRIQLPSEGLVTDATMTRDGDDLVLQAPNGEVDAHEQIALDADMAFQAL